MQVHSILSKIGSRVVAHSTIKNPNILQIDKILDKFNKLSCCQSAYKTCHNTEYNVPNLNGSNRWQLYTEGPIYQIWMGSHLQKSKDGRKMPNMQMAAFFGESLLSQLLHYLESHVWSQNWDIQGQGIHSYWFQVFESGSPSKFDK